MKIAICTPVHGDPKAGFTKSLADMLIHVGGRHEMAFFTYSGSMLDTSRNALLDQATRWGADFILWMDADHVFPPDTLDRLLAAGKQVIGVNFRRRDAKARPTATVLRDGKEALVASTPELAATCPVEQVVHIGLGICLVDMAVIRGLGAGAKRLFRFTEASSEDIHLFRTLAEAGVPAFVDHALSLECGHIHEQVLRFE
jgi:hypothetical protein